MINIYIYILFIYTALRTIVYNSLFEKLLGELKKTSKTNKMCFVAWVHDLIGYSSGFSRPGASTL